MRRTAHDSDPRARLQTLFVIAGARQTRHATVQGAGRRGAPADATVIRTSRGSAGSEAPLHRLGRVPSLPRWPLLAKVGIFNLFTEVKVYNQVLYVVIGIMVQANGVNLLLIYLG